MVARGWLDRRAAGVFVVTGAPNTWRQQLRVALLAAGDLSVISHDSAAALHRLEGFDPGVVCITVPRSARNRTVPGTIHSARRLDRVDIGETDGFRCTTPTRTLIDLAGAGCSAGALARAVDSAVHQGVTSPGYLRRRLDELGRQGRPGVRLLDELLLDAGGHTYLERRFLRLVRESGLRRPRYQVAHRSAGKPVVRVDFEWTSERVVVEVAGRLGHSSDRERAKDAHRRNKLQAEGFVVLEFTTGQVVGSPDQVIALVRHQLASNRSRIRASGRAKL